MRIFVAGATGAIGRRLVMFLLAAGHQVVGLTHSPNKTAVIGNLGALAVVGDGLDKASVRQAVAAAKPDVIVHEMTDLKGASDLRHFDKAFELTNRLRTEGLDYLLAAAREFGVKRVVAQSFCGWNYARIGEPIKSEADPLDPEPPRELKRTLDAIQYLEDIVTQSREPEGVVLRYGAFYGPGTGVFDGGFVEQLLKRRVPIIGEGDGWWSFVQVDDAARATVAAIAKGSPGNIYNIVDDEPAPVKVWLPALAQMLGAKPPRHLPVWLARIVAGEHLVTMMNEARAGSNAKARRDLGWTPDPPSWRQGFAKVLQKSGLLKQAA
jgi:nucleoside-diphosphate-sugar epimerase